MKTNFYFLFGDTACRILNEYDIDVLVDKIRDEEIDVFEIMHYDSETEFPYKILSQYEGYGGWKELNQMEYVKINVAIQDSKHHRQELNLKNLKIFVEKVNTLYDAFQDLGKFWTEAELPEHDISVDYPFNGSFNEIAMEVANWKEAINNIIQK